MNDRATIALVRERASAHRQSLQLFRLRRSIRSRRERRAYVREAVERVRALDAALAALQHSEVVEASKGSLWDRLRDHKRREIALALMRNRFSRTHTAKELKMCRRALINNIAELGLQSRLAVRQAARLSP